VRSRTVATYAADVIVFATGFHANRFLWPMEIVGRGGLSLREHWGDEPPRLSRHHDPEVFRTSSVSTDGYEPRTRRQHHLSLECQVRLRDGLPGCTGAERGAANMECRQEIRRFTSSASTPST